MADIRYEVILNGRLLCISGVEGPGGVLSVTLSWVKRPRRPDDEVPGDEDVLESHYLGVDGLDTTIRKHLRWCEEPIQPGDEIVIRVLAQGTADVPHEYIDDGPSTHS